MATQSTRGNGTTRTAAAPAGTCSLQVRRTAGTTVPVPLTTTISAISIRSPATQVAMCGGISRTPKGRRSPAPIPSLERAWLCMSALTTSAWTLRAPRPLALLMLGTPRSTVPPASESPAVRSGSFGLTGSSRETILEVAVFLPSLATMLTSSLSTSTASSSARSQRDSQATQASSTRTDQVSCKALSRRREDR